MHECPLSIHYSGYLNTYETITHIDIVAINVRNTTLILLLGSTLVASGICANRWYFYGNGNTMNITYTGLCSVSVAAHSIVITVLCRCFLLTKVMI